MRGAWLVAVVLLSLPRPAAGQAGALWSPLEVPGGWATLETAGLGPADRGPSLLVLARRLHASPARRDAPERALARPLANAAAAASLEAGDGGPPPGPQEPRPQFEARAELVLVDVTVLDGRGRPVEGLSIDDFELQVNGRPRPIDSLQFIASGEGGAPALPGDGSYSRNDAHATGRLLLFVVDEGSLRFGAGRTVLAAAEGVVARLAPGDPAGLVRLPLGGGIEFTTDRQRLRDALGQVTGRAASPGMQQGVFLTEAVALERGGPEWDRAVQRECAGLTTAFTECVASLEGEARARVLEQSRRTFQTVRALEGLLERLAPLGLPVTLIVISEGLFVATDRTPLSRLGQLAAEARATLHVIQPGQDLFSIESAHPLYAVQDEGLMSEGLELLAAQTGGALHRLGGAAGAGTFDRLGTELSGYYLLGFVPTAEDRTGRERRIRVQVRRRGLTVRARPTFVVRETGSAAVPLDTVPPDRSSPAAIEEHLQKVLASPLPVRGLPLRTATFTSLAADPGLVRLTIAAEVGEETAERAEIAEIPVAVWLLDRDNRLVQRASFRATASPATGGAPGPRLVLASLLVEPGEYTLRLAAVDGARAGSVHHPVRAVLARLAEGLEVSDLVIVAAAEGPGDRTRPAAAGLLRAATISAMLEIRGRAAEVRNTRLAVELATGPDAAPLLRAEARHADRADGAERAFEAALDVAALPPGEYVARALVAVPGQPVRSIVRLLRLEPPPRAHLGAHTASRGGGAGASLESAAPPGAAAVIPAIPRLAPRDALDPATVGLVLDELGARLPLSPEAAAVLARARAGRFEAPEPDARTTPADEAALALVRGLAALDRGQAQQAFAWFRQAQRGASEALGITFYLGAALALQGQDREAAGAWQLALLSGAAPAVYAPLVDTLLRLREVEQARALLEEADAAGTWTEGSARARRWAAAHAMLGQYEEALTLLAPLIESAPGDADLLFMGLQVLFRLRVEGGAWSAERHARFEQWADAYARIRGPLAALVESWRAHLRR